MRFLRAVGLVSLGLFPSFLAGYDLLQTDLDGILEEAGETGRHVYVAFLGSGWSLACKRFEDACLDHPDFRKLAEERLLYCPVKARRKPKLSKEETARLQSLVIHFDIKSYPTVILLAPDGREVLRHGYRDLEGSDYARTIEALLPEPGNP